MGRKDKNNRIDDAKLDDVLCHAEACFWMEVARLFPEIKTGDMPPEAVVPLRDHMVEAICTWYDINSPPLPPQLSDEERATLRAAAKLVREKGRATPTDDFDKYDLASYLEITANPALAEPTLDHGAAAVARHIRSHPAEPLTVDIPAPTRVGWVSPPCEMYALTQEQLMAAQGFPPPADDCEMRRYPDGGTIGVCTCDPRRDHSSALRPPIALPMTKKGIEWANFVASLPAYHNWVATWEYPGFIQWSNDLLPWVHVVATPDWSKQGEIAYDVQDVTGSRIKLASDNYPGDEVFEDLIDWPMEGRTPESYMALIGPRLDKFTDALASAYCAETASMLEHCGLEPEGNFMIDDDLSTTVTLIPEEAPGAWVTVEVWIDAESIVPNLRDENYSESAAKEDRRNGGQ